MAKYLKQELINAVGMGYGELSLKGKNRGKFEQALKSRIGKILKKYDAKFYMDMSKLYVLVNKENNTDVIESMRKIFGINSLTPSIMIESTVEDIKREVLDIAINAYEEGARNFKVEVSRRNKKFEIGSMDFARELGGHILVNSSFENVKMKNPDILINIDIREKTYIFAEKIRTYGGLPLGSAGKGMSLISGGIDSPVASFMMAKRGMKVKYVTFHSFPFTSKQALEKIKELVEILSVYNDKSRLYSINILKIQQVINEKTNKELATILTRRVMMRLAERLAIENDHMALVTGESLGQVASQTFGGLTCTNASVETLPVFRPLIGMDKLEIMDIAREIGTYEKSIEPHEDTCVIFAPKNPVTNPKIEYVLREESKIENYDELLEEIYNDKEYFNIG